MGENKDLSPYSSGSPFTLIAWEPFNPGSVSQIVQRMNAAGWRPINKTKGHIQAERDKKDLTEWRVKGWKVDDENLETLPDVDRLKLWRDSCRTEIQKIDKSTKEIIIKIIEKNTSNTKSITIKEIQEFLKINTFKELMELITMSLTDLLPTNLDVAQFVEKQSPSWSIIVTEQVVYVDCSVTFVTDVLDGLRNIQELQSRISQIEAAKKLSQFLLMKSRLSDLEEWLKACDDNNVIHGTFNPIGSWTHRMSHTSPNMANIPALINRKGKPQYLGKEMRAMWLAREGRKLVGVDADAIQLRIFAHIVNSKSLIDALVSGRKEDGTDAHTINKGIIEQVVPSSREVAKTYLYALFLGAAAGKQSEVLSCNRAEAKEVYRLFMRHYPEWAELKQKRIPEDAARGYFQGLDGRLVRCSSEHLMLAGYLQNGEKIVMARAATQFQKGIEEDDLPCSLVNFVHDELQYEVEDRDDWPEFVGGLAMQYIVRQGEELELNCPLAANMKVGNNWAETH